MTNSVINLSRFIIIIFLCLNLGGCKDRRDDRVALGSLERERILLTATDNQLVHEVFATEGDKVKKGDALVQLDESLANSMIAESIANLRSAKAELMILENGARKEDIAAAKARLTSAKAELDYQEKTLGREIALAEEGVQPKSELDRVKSKFDAAKANYQDAKEQLVKLEKGARVEDIMQAKSKVDAAKAHLEISKQKAQELKIIATRDGVIEALPWNVGERVSTGSPVAVLLAKGTAFARVYIPESQRTKLKLGDKVIIRIDGLKSQRGTIKKIATQPSFTPYYGLSAGERSRLVYLAEVNLSEDADELPSGIPVVVEFKK